MKSARIIRKSKYTNRAKGSGFTLIEMMVSVSIFLIIMVISLGAVLAIVDGNKKAQAINSVSNNLASAIESMVRDIKTGFAYSCGTQTMPLGSTEYSEGANSCNYEDEYISNNPAEITFISTISGEKRTVRYHFEEDASGRGKIKKTFCPASIETCLNGNYLGIEITSPDIDIEALEFRIRRPRSVSSTLDSNQYGQPSVFILLKGTAYVDKTTTSDFSMQTLVSQRVLNI